MYDSQNVIRKEKFKNAAEKEKVFKKYWWRQIKLAWECKILQKESTHRIKNWINKIVGINIEEINKM